MKFSNGFQEKIDIKYYPSRDGFWSLTLLTLGFLIPLVNGCTIGGGNSAEDARNDSTKSTAEETDPGAEESNILVAGQLVIEEFKTDASDPNAQLSQEDVDFVTGTAETDLIEAGKLAVESGLRLTGETTERTPLLIATDVVSGSILARMKASSLSDEQKQNILTILAGATIKGAKKAVARDTIKNSLETGEVVGVFQRISAKLIKTLKDAAVTKAEVAAFSKRIADKILDNIDNDLLGTDEDASLDAVMSGLATGAVGLEYDGQTVADADNPVASVNEVLFDVYNTRKGTSLRRESKEDFDVLARRILRASVQARDTAYGDTVEFVTQETIVTYEGTAEDVEKIVTTVSTAFEEDETLVRPDDFDQVVLQPELYQELEDANVITAEEKEEISQTTTEAVVAVDSGEKDSDGDGVLDSRDAFPNDPKETRDTDGDGTGNNADTDDDGDGALDADDAFPLDATMYIPFIETKLVEPVTKINSASVVKVDLVFKGKGFITFDETSVSNNRGCATAVSRDRRVGQIELKTCAGDGPLVLRLKPGIMVTGATSSAVKDLTGIAVDNTGPSATTGTVSPSLGNMDATFTFPFTFDEAIGNVDPSKIEIFHSGGASSCKFTHATSGNVLTVEVMECGGDGSVSVSLKEGFTKDDLGNVSTAVSSTAVTIDNTPPDPPMIGARLLNLAPSYGPVNFTWVSSTSSDATSDYQLKIGSDDFSESAINVSNATHYTFTDPLSVGTNILFIRQKDGAGNWSSAGEYEFTVKHPFVFKLTTTSSNLSKVFNGYFGYSYDMVIDWGDGTSSHITTYNQTDLDHTYATPGTYTVRIYGLMEKVSFSNAWGEVTEIVRLGDTGLLSLENGFNQLGGLTRVSTMPGDNTSAVTTMMFAFARALAFLINSDSKNVQF